MMKHFIYSPYKTFLLAFADAFCDKFVTELKQLAVENSGAYESQIKASAKASRKVEQIAILMQITNFSTLSYLSTHFLCLNKDVYKSLSDHVYEIRCKLSMLPPVVFKDEIFYFFFDHKIHTLYV